MILYKLIMRCGFWVFLLSLLFLSMHSAVAVGIAQPVSSSSSSGSPPSSDKITEIIHTLQDPKAREQLIQQLTILAQAQQGLPAATTTVKPGKNQSSLTLINLSKSISQIHFGATQLVAAFVQGKQALDKLAVNLAHSNERRIFEISLFKCLVVIILGYSTFSLFDRFMPAVYKRFAKSTQKNLAVRILNLFILWFLTLLPIAAFAVISYFAVVLLQLHDRAEWILLAWISSFVIVKVVLAIYDFVFAFLIQLPNFLALSDSAVYFVRSWFRFLTGLIVYGYFILQVSLFLGVSLDIYDSLIKLLGFFVVLALMVFVLRNPLRMVKLIASRRAKIGEVTISDEKIASIDILFRVAAIIYLFLLYVVWIVRANHFFWFVLKGTLLSIILIFLALYTAQFLHRLLSRDFKVSSTLKKRLPGLESRFKRYRRVLNIVLRALIYVIVFLAILKIWGGSQMTWLPDMVKQIILIKVISILCIGLVSMFIWEFSNSLIELSLTKKGEDITIESGRTHTLLIVARRTVLIILSLIALLMVLSEIGVNIGPLLAGAGVLGLAVGLGAQKVVTDVITGFLILMENQIAVGDYVTIGDQSGTVESISIRTVRLRDTSGVVNIIPYSSIVTVSNFTKDFSYYLLEISIAYREDVDEVIAVLHKLSTELQKIPEFRPFILEPLQVLGLDKFLDSSVIIKARLKTKPGMQWIVGREFNRRMKKRFDELNIEIPFPHTTVYFGEKKEGTAPAAHLQVELERSFRRVE